MSDSFQRRAYKILDRLVGYELDKAWQEYHCATRSNSAPTRAYSRLQQLSDALCGGFGRYGRRIAAEKGLPTDAEWEDSLHGGKGDRKTPSDFEKKELEKGQKVELEHTGQLPYLAREGLVLSSCANAKRTRETGRLEWLR